MTRRTSEIKLKITLITTLDDEGALWNAYHIVDCNLIKNHTKPGMSLSFAHVVPRRKQTSILIHVKWRLLCVGTSRKSYLLVGETFLLYTSVSFLKMYCLSRTEICFRSLKKSLLKLYSYYLKAFFMTSSKEWYAYRSL